MEYKALYNKAHEAGMAAGTAAVPTPMVVAQHANVLDDNSPVTKAWYVESGVCGFAWVHVKGNTSFGRWAKSAGLAGKDYPSGLSFWVHEFNQSYERKMAYARAFAKVLSEHGVAAYVQGRLD